MAKKKDKKLDGQLKIEDVIEHPSEIKQNEIADQSSEPIVQSEIKESQPKNKGSKTLAKIVPQNDIKVDIKDDTKEVDASIENTSTVEPMKKLKSRSYTKASTPRKIKEEKTQKSKVPQKTEEKSRLELEESKPTTKMV